VIAEIIAQTQFNESVVRLAQQDDLVDIKALVDVHRHELGFVNRAVLEKAIEDQEILYISGKGFLHFHNRRDGISTLYHLCVSPHYRYQGIGRQLIHTWEELCRRSKTCVKRLRLKCPIDLRANGFYCHIGFSRAGVEAGRSRSLIVWEKKLLPDAPRKPDFFASLSMGGGDLMRLRKWWNFGEDPRQRNPFEKVIYSPISCPPSTTDYLHRLRHSSKTKKLERVKELWFDCGAYQVQQGKFTYDELLEFLGNFYQKNPWADGYVLPDIVPLSTDSDEIVDYKVRETLFNCRKFFESLPEYVQERAIAPIQGRTVSHISQCIETYAQLGIKRVGFGSWGTSGPNGSVNMLSKQSLAIFQNVCDMALEYGMSVHCFGIGGPNSLNRLREYKAVPHSLDSTTWWKAAGFGGIFFPHRSQIHITVRRGVETTKLGFDDLKSETKHECKFCQNLEDLRKYRHYRIMHNLSAWLDTLEQIDG